MTSGRTISIIGSAGRRDDAARINRRIYDAMFAEAADAIAEWKPDALCSGGAAFADHVAVRAYLEGLVPSLVLFLPAEFDGRYRETSARDDPGRTTNRYHRAFSSSCGLDSLSELTEAIRRGADARVHRGFKNRNLEVANVATHLLACTFGRDVPPANFGPEDAGFSSSRDAGLKDGGTAHTWGEAWKCLAKRHLSLTWLEHKLESGPRGP
jgi:hypothetical protein